MAPGTDAGLQLFTRGRLAASGGALPGGALIPGPWDRLPVGPVPGTVASDTPGVDGIGEGIGLPECTVAQPAATTTTAMHNAPATALW
jgi:hypothetical protein